MTNNSSAPGLQPPAVEVLRYAAFSRNGAGGNPAGVVLEAATIPDSARLAVAADVGYSETAFIEPVAGSGHYRLRFYSPLAEVAFCGHATIATAVAMAERRGTGELHFDTLAGPIKVLTRESPDGYTATLTSVPTSTRPAEDDELDATLEALRWDRDELDSRYPAHVAYAGNNHLILAARDRARLARLDYDFDRLAELMSHKNWTTLHLVFAHSPLMYSARNPFPPGGVYEDPATGAAAAAFGGYLRTLGLVDPPATITVLQGEDMERPSRLEVQVIAETDQVLVTGAAVALTTSADPLP